MLVTGQMRARTELSRVVQQIVWEHSVLLRMSRILVRYGEAASWVGLAYGIAEKLELLEPVTRDDSCEPLEMTSAVERTRQERSTAVGALYNREMIVLCERGIKMNDLALVLSCRLGGDGGSCYPTSSQADWSLSTSDFGFADGHF
jgi:hypothetical protein